MDEPKYQFSFSRSMSPAEAITKGFQLLAALRQLPDVHQPLPPLSDTLDRLEAALVGLRDDHEATAAGNKTRIPSRESALDQVVDKLNRIGAHVRLAAWDNAHLLHHAGFDAVKSKPVPSPLTAPEKFTVKNLDEDGAVTCSTACVRGAKNYEVLYTSDDPTAETWTGKEIFARATKLKISGLEQGKRYYFRIRTVGANGERGPWSSIASLIIT